MEIDDRWGLIIEKKIAPPETSSSLPHPFALSVTARNLCYNREYEKYHQI